MADGCGTRVLCLQRLGGELTVRNTKPRVSRSQPHSPSHPHHELSPSPLWVQEYFSTLLETTPRQKMMSILNPDASLPEVKTARFCRILVGALKCELHSVCDFFGAIVPTRLGAGRPSLLALAASFSRANIFSFALYSPDCSFLEELESYL